MSDGEEHPAGGRPEPQAFPDMRPADDGAWDDETSSDISFEAQVPSPPMSRL